jgi:hypothetical protein
MDHVPSVLNGALGKISVLCWITVIAITEVIDFVGTGCSQKMASGKDVYLANTAALTILEGTLKWGG